MISRLRALSAFLVLSITMTGCAVNSNEDPTGTASGTNEPGGTVSDESPEIVFDDWFTALIGTMNATGKTTFISGNGEAFPDEGRSVESFTYEDFMPGSPCARGTSEDDDSGFLSLSVTTDDGYTDLAPPLEKVASYWRSQGWEPETTAGTAGVSESIMTRTTEGATVHYTAGAGGDTVDVNSRCLNSFNPDFIAE